MKNSTRPVVVRLCSAPGCGKRHLARGLCKPHYDHAQRVESGYTAGKVQVPCARCGTPCWKKPDSKKGYQAR